MSYDGDAYLSGILARLDPNHALNAGPESIPSDLTSEAELSPVAIIPVSPEVITAAATVGAVSLGPDNAESAPISESDRETGDSLLKTQTDNIPITLTSSVPPPKRYAHHGKRRRSYTEEMFRCQHVDKISRSDLVCNSLLWKNRPETLREHLLEHLTVDQVEKMTDDEVIKWYSEAKRIFLQGIPEDCDDEDEDNTEDE